MVSSHDQVVDQRQVELGGETADPSGGSDVLRTRQRGTGRVIVSQDQRPRAKIEGASDQIARAGCQPAGSAGSNTLIGDVAMAAIEEDGMQQFVRMRPEQVLQIVVEIGIVRIYATSRDFFLGGCKDKRARGAHLSEHVGVLAVLFDTLPRDQSAMKRPEAIKQSGCYRFCVRSRERLDEARHER